MKLFSIIAFFIFSVTICDAQDAIFKTLISKSNIIVKATVLEIGPKFSSDGVWNNCILCVIDESYKGIFHKGDSIRIYTTEVYAEKKDSSSKNIEIIRQGNSLLFFLSKQPSMTIRFNSDTKLYPAYPPVDRILGIQVPTREMVSYLQQVLNSH